MNINFFSEALILLGCSLILLRLAGKKTIAQMTSLETVVVLAIGTTMGHAIKEHKLWQILVILAVFVLFLITVQFLQTKFDKLEFFLIGKATVVIKDGNINVDNLKKLRMTTDQLEMRLREKGIAYIADVQTATIESNGVLGYELKEDAQPLTRGELTQLLNIANNTSTTKTRADNLFNKVK